VANRYLLKIPLKYHRNLIASSVRRNSIPTKLHQVAFTSFQFLCIYSDTTQTSRLMPLPDGIRINKAINYLAVGP